MKNRIVAIAILAIAAVGTASAQEGSAPAEKAPATKPTQDPAVKQQREEAQAARRMEASQKLAQDLGLNEEQTAKLKEIDAEYASDMDALRTSTDREKTQEGARLAREKREMKLKEVLTPEQFQKMESMRAENRNSSIKKAEEMKEKKAAE